MTVCLFYLKGVDVDGTEVVALHVEEVRDLPGVPRIGDRIRSVFDVTVKVYDVEWGRRADGSWGAILSTEADDSEPKEPS